jgi:peptidoglycan/LPS O-acetylase OafA/YrhL
MTLQRRTPLLGHVPALDGLRGVAVALVVIYHFVGHYVLRGGSTGVDVFFGLSGFLITALILDELHVHGRLAALRFYGRRACRLLPALVFLLMVWTALLIAFHDHGWFSATPNGNGVGRIVAIPEALADVGIALFYGANWNVIDGGMEAPIPHLWSLAVEEQFYLVWPAALLCILRLPKRWRAPAVLALTTLSAAVPFLYGTATQLSREHIYFGTDTRAVGLLAGALAALVWHRRKAEGRATRYGGARAWAGLAVIGYFAFTGQHGSIRLLFCAALLALAVSQVIPSLADGHPMLTRVFCAPGLAWLGKRSYGLYLWHYPWATWTHPLGLPGVPLGLLGALVCTQISWVLIESPALRYGRRFRVPVPPPAPTADRADELVAAGR